MKKVMIVKVEEAGDDVRLTLTVRRRGEMREVAARVKKGLVGEVTMGTVELPEWKVKEIGDRYNGKVMCLDPKFDNWFNK